MPDSLRRIAKDVIRCRACPRLVEHRESTASTKRRAYHDCEYWGRPVPGFGDPRARLVLIGLAPGAHGSNRTGRMFTGDASGDFLFATLHATGFSSRAAAVSIDDGLVLEDCYITAAARCAPPGNRPSPEELALCQPFLRRELSCLRRARVYLALGRIGFDALWRVLPEIGFAVSGRKPEFGHGVSIDVSRVHDAGRAARVSENASANGAVRILCSYHPSRQNTQTGRLTRSMFLDVFTRARERVEVA